MTSENGTEMARCPRGTEKASPEPVSLSEPTSLPSMSCSPETSG